jgi:colicin import membrane protein
VQIGLIVSVVLHAALLGWAFITIHTQRDMRAFEPEPIVTGIISESDLTKLKQGVRTAKQLEAMAKEAPKPDVANKETPKPKPVAAPPPPPPPEPKSDPIAEKLASAEPPPPPPPPAVDEQKQREAAAQKQEAARKAEEKRRADEQRVAAEAQRLAEEQKREDERKAEQKRAEEQRRVEEEHRQVELKRKADDERKQREAAAKKKREDEAKRRQAEAKRKQEEERRRQEAEAKKAKEKFDPDAIEKQLALIDRDPRKKNAAAATPPPENETKQKGPALGAPEGRDQKISASEIAMIGQVIRSCVASKWNVLSGGVSAQETLVKIRLQFNSDGTLNKAPEVMNPQRTPYFVAISESAVRAVQDCEPFNLPAPRYEVWRDIVINFQPKDMY